MEDLDPIFGQEINLKDVFVHAPTEFELMPWKLSWDSPCWVNADIILRPRTLAVRAKFCGNLKLPHKLDAFARVSWKDQLSGAFSPRLSQIESPHANEWFHELLRCYGELKKILTETGSLFPQPFRFLTRQEYTTVDLATILKESPEKLSVYLASEKGKYRNYDFLRVHSSQPSIAPHSKGLWFEKRLPDCVDQDDVLPWFLSTVCRLPKKHQPQKIETWTQRLLHFDPQLAISTGGAEKPWAEKPKIVFVFGPTGMIGYRGLTHFERRDISRIVRHNETITIEGKTRHVFRNNSTMEIERTFHLLALDQEAAERVERQIFLGNRVYFGLNADILGMIYHSGHVINALNAPVEVIRRICVTSGEDLRLVSNPRDKCKSYELVTS